MIDRKEKKQWSRQLDTVLLVVSDIDEKGMIRE